MSEAVVVRSIPAEPLSVRLSDGVCFVFALWTLCSFASVALGLTLSSLVWLFVACLLLARLLPLSLGSRLDLTKVDDGAEVPARYDSSRWLGAAWGSAFAATAGIVLWLRPGTKVIWWCVIGLLAAALLIVFRDRPRLVEPTESPARERLLWLLALACVVIALVSHRPDADDAQYVDIAASAADLTSWPLLSSDTLHGIPGLPLIQPIYRAHSYELWNGALSLLTGIPAIYCFHWLSASLVALLLPLAWARLFRILTPERWLTATALFIFVLLAVGETHRWYGNFALVRVWQGKALFLFVFMPLVYTYAIRFGLWPNRRDWLLLCAAQIAAMGSSSTALWCAPLGAGLAFASVWRPSRKNLPALIWSGLASSVLIFVGLSLRQQMTSFVVRIQEAQEPPVAWLPTALEQVLGDDRLVIVATLSVLLAWLFSRRVIARRWLVCMPFFFLVLLFNPYTAKQISIHVTGPAFWRTLWAVPMPLFLTFVLLAPMTWSPRGGGPRRRWAVRLAVLAAAFAFAAWVPRFHGLSEQNGVAIHRPSLKVPEPEYQVAQKLQDSVGPRAYVVVAGPVNPWIPTMHHHAYPLIVRDFLSSRRMRNVLGSQEVNRRKAMHQFVSGVEMKPDAARVLDEGLDRYRVEGVCLRRTRLADTARRILVDRGFHQIYERGDYELWTRKLDPS